MVSILSASIKSRSQPEVKEVIYIKYLEIIFNGVKIKKDNEGIKNENNIVIGRINIKAEKAKNASKLLIKLTIAKLL